MGGQSTYPLTTRLYDDFVNLEIYPSSLSDVLIGMIFII
jgi:hypothetical protein